MQSRITISKNLVEFIIKYVSEINHIHVQLFGKMMAGKTQSSERMFCGLELGDSANKIKMQVIPSESEVSKVFGAEAALVDQLYEAFNHFNVHKLDNIDEIKKILAIKIGIADSLQSWFVWKQFIATLKKNVPAELGECEAFIVNALAFKLRSLVFQKYTFDVTTARILTNIFNCQSAEKAQILIREETLEKTLPKSIFNAIYFTEHLKNCDAAVRHNDPIEFDRIKTMLMKYLITFEESLENLFKREILKDVDGDGKLQTIPNANFTLFKLQNNAGLLTLNAYLLKMFEDLNSFKVERCQELKTIVQTNFVNIILNHLRKKIKEIERPLPVLQSYQVLLQGIQKANLATLEVSKVTNAKIISKYEKKIISKIKQCKVFDLGMEVYHAKELRKKEKKRLETKDEKQKKHLSLDPQQALMIPELPHPAPLPQSGSTSPIKRSTTQDSLTAIVKTLSNTSEEENRIGPTLFNTASKKIRRDSSSGDRDKLSQDASEKSLTTSDKDKKKNMGDTSRMFSLPKETEETKKGSVVSLVSHKFG